MGWPLRPRPGARLRPEHARQKLRLWGHPVRMSCKNFLTTHQLDTHFWTEFLYTFSWQYDPSRRVCSKRAFFCGFCLRMTLVPSAFSRREACILRKTHNQCSSPDFCMSMLWIALSTFYDESLPSTHCLVWSHNKQLRFCKVSFTATLREKHLSSTCDITTEKSIS
jgi:hypothetical protein